MTSWSRSRESLTAFAILFTGLFLSHAPLLRLPYFWDEAGYFIPAARDLLLTGSLVPHSTLSNAHPPLLMLWLAFWWKFSAFTPAVTRTAMLLVGAFALTGVWRLARSVAPKSVAVATVLCTGLYPVFFAQSSLAQLDLAAAALTIWGLAEYVEGRFGAAVVFLAVAPLAKETALITPLALAGWELLCPHLRFTIAGERLCVCDRSTLRSAALLLCAIPISLWLVYHHHVTGYYLGNPEYLRYNLVATLTPLRILLTFLVRLWQLLGYLNLLVLTLGMAYAMSRPALLERNGSERPRIAVSVQLVFGVVILAYLAFLSLVGGAVLARYLLPIYPLVVLICVSTLRRRVRGWGWWIALACAAFILALVTPPVYRVSPEDTLLYRDYVLLHKRAADLISAVHPHSRVLTAWPASDELSRPYLGYVKEPVQVVRIENFSELQMAAASRATEQFDIVLLFSTKWEPPHPLLATLPFGTVLHERYFDYHEDVTPQRAAEILGGRVLQLWNRQNEWLAIISIEKIQNASLQSHK